MSPQNFNSQTSGTENGITLGLLTAVDNNSSVTQRSMAHDLGIALGLANAYLKRCVKKGYIKIQQIPANRYAYYLTPKGFAEKSRLTAEFLSQSFRLFRVAREQYSAILADCIGHDWKRIAIYGATDLAEIIIICSRDYPVKLVGIVANSEDSTFGEDVPITTNLSDLDHFDAILIADASDPQNIFERLSDQVGADRVLAPDIFNISADRPGPAMLDEIQ